MTTKKLPKKIKNCPIVEAIVELRFESLLPRDAVFGVIYDKFKTDFSSEPKSLPILQIPETMRSQDPNLIFKPHYQLIDERFIFQIGPKVVSFSIKDDYVGWSAFSSRIKIYFDKIKELKIVNKSQRLGLRYINFFNNINIFDKIKLEMVLDKKPLASKNLYIKTTIESNGFLNTLQVSNDAMLQRSNIPTKGSIIDIDTYCEKDGKEIIENIDDLLEKGHIEEKFLFYDLPTPEFLKELDPIY
ncbi:MAG: TIGR04255 family protein [Candidatus Omnitrophica bacterium]|nr:TIGR04255 family protein [Candidatus Omnitrophota bacterium]